MNLGIIGAIAGLGQGIANAGTNMIQQDNQDALFQRQRELEQMRIDAQKEMQQSGFAHAEKLQSESIGAKKEMHKESIGEQRYSTDMNFTANMAQLNATLAKMAQDERHFRSNFSLHKRQIDQVDRQYQFMVDHNLLTDVDKERFNALKVGIQSDMAAAKDEMDPARKGQLVDSARAKSLELQGLAEKVGPQKPKAPDMTSGGPDRKLMGGKYGDSGTPSVAPPPEAPAAQGIISQNVQQPAGVDLSSQFDNETRQIENGLIKDYSPAVKSWLLRNDDERARAEDAYMKREQAAMLRPRL